MAFYPRKKPYNRKRPYRRNRKPAAASKIARAYRRYRGYKPRVARPLIGGGNYIVKKCRVNAQIQFNQLRDVTNDNGKRFEIYFAPWQNVGVLPPTNSNQQGFGTGNLFYHQDFATMFETGKREYNLFRLKAVYMEIRRPDRFIEAANSINREYLQASKLPFGTEILHTRTEIQADNVTGQLQPTLSQTKYGRTIVSPSNWREAVDDGARFKVTYGNYQKRVWKPSTPAEKHWRFTASGAELEHSTGGICIMSKDSLPVPGVATNNNTIGNTIAYDIMATVYMEFKVKV